MFPKSMLLLIGALVVLFVGVSLISPTPTDQQTELKTFSSEAEVREFLKDNMEGGFQTEVLERSAVAESAKTDGVSYSRTNVQVAGVDEADIVKTDGRFIYTISGDIVTIVEAFPPENAQIVSMINLSGSQPQNLYINEDRLVLFGNDYNEDGGVIPLREQAISIFPVFQSSAYIKIYDISNPAAPILTRNLEFNGSYTDSRMIGDYVYTIITTQPYYVGGDVVVPQFTPTQRAFPEIYYFDVPDFSYQFTNIIATNIKDDASEIENKVFLLGYSNALYVSQNNIYLTYQKQVSQYDVYNRILDEILLPEAPQDVRDMINNIRNSDRAKREKQQLIAEVLEEWYQDIGPEEAGRLQQRFEERYQTIQEELAKEYEKSVIHKININNGQINYQTKGEVPGQPLNQFSMDEHNGYFRIATTTGNWRVEPSNHLYVLDEGMNIVGRLEDLAPGERIFSTRFLGDRAYLVTFVRVDPLFVIDLSNPTNPTLLGELKIPGVSDYLHPYDENHLIGVGRSTEEAGERVTFKGLKIALFDVTDVSNPQELDAYELGELGTDSEALRDHKAFLFDKEKELLVMPVTLNEERENDGFTYPEAVWQGAYIFTLNLEGIELRGRVTHVPDSDKEFFYFNAPYFIRRSLYIEDFLYTISDKVLKINDLNSLNETASVELPSTFSPYWGVAIK